MDKKIIIGIVVIALVLIAGAFLGEVDEVIYSSEEAESVAEQWILENSPTYLERGGGNLTHATTHNLGEGLFEVIFDFEASFAGYGEVDEDEMAAQVITPHTVMVTVDKNQVVKVVTDEAFDEMTGDFVEDEDVDENDRQTETQTIPLELYFVRVSEGAEEVVSVSRDLEIETIEEEAVIEALLKGVTSQEEEQGYSTSIPEGTELLSYSFEDGVATVDFSSDIEPGGGSAWVMAIRDQITKTLMQFEFVEEVVILVEGEEGLQP